MHSEWRWRWAPCIRVVDQYCNMLQKSIFFCCCAVCDDMIQRMESRLEVMWHCVTWSDIVCDHDTSHRIGSVTWSEVVWYCSPAGLSPPCRSSACSGGCDQGQVYVRIIDATGRTIWLWPWPWPWSCVMCDDALVRNKKGEQWDGIAGQDRTNQDNTRQYDRIKFNTIQCSKIGDTCPVQFRIPFPLPV